MSGSPEELQGTLRSIRHQRDGFLIASLDDGTAVKGDMPAPRIGQEYLFRGRWEEHSRWGRQFAFSQYRTCHPTDLAAVGAYLEETCKWVGPGTARRLVEAYGAGAIAVFREDPERVAREIPGLTLPKAREASNSLKDNESHERLQIELGELLEGTGVNRGALGRILRLWGGEAPGRIHRNPYALIADIEGVGFLTADRVATKLGFDREGGPRLRAGLLHVLQSESFARGHTCMPRELLLKETSRLLGLEAGPLEAELPALESEGLLVESAGSFSLRPLHDDETLVARRILALLRGSPPPGQPDFEGLQADQQEALAKAVASPVFILTGAPGTGKTFTIRRILSSFPGVKVALAAPTGKAAKRITEQSGQAASTIHKLLEPKFQAGGRLDFCFSRDASNPIAADLIVLDEVSMVDIPLMARFLDAVAAGTRLILVGDQDQLPSVGPGNVLKDLIASGQVPSTELTVIKRQDEGHIILNCHRIKHGQDLSLDGAAGSDFLFLRRSDEEGIRQALLELVTTSLPRDFNADPLKDIQVITPLRERTSLSCEALNALFQERLNPVPLPPGSRFKAGDKVIQTKNRYDLDLVNGDMGTVLDVSTKARSIVVDFGNAPKPMELPLHGNDLELAYAITCHKFQGSEARIVVIPIHRAFGPLILQRNWLYTAVSRAREVCVLVGHRDEIPRIIGRNQQQRRHTRLAWLLGT